MNRLQSRIRPWGEQVTLGSSWNRRIESQSLEAALKARKVIGLVRFRNRHIRHALYIARQLGGTSSTCDRVASHADVIGIEVDAVVFHRHSRRAVLLASARRLCCGRRAQADGCGSLALTFDASRRQPLSSSVKQHMKLPAGLFLSRQPCFVRALAPRDIRPTHRASGLVGNNSMNWSHQDILQILAFS